MTLNTWKASLDRRIASWDLAKPANRGALFIAVMSRVVLFTARPARRLRACLPTLEARMPA
jgi:hypothetical protein